MSDDTRERLRAMGEHAAELMRQLRAHLDSGRCDWGGPDACEYCGRPGCHWSRHPAAVVEVRLDAAGVLPGWEPWRDDPRHDEANP